MPRHKTEPTFVVASPAVVTPPEAIDNKPAEVVAESVVNVPATAADATKTTIDCGGIALLPKPSVTATFQMASPVNKVYKANHVDMQLNAYQSDVLQMLMYGAQLGKCRLKNGRIVNNVPDVIRHLLETIGSQGKIQPSV